MTAEISGTRAQAAVRSGRPGLAARPRGSAHLIKHPGPGRGGLAAQLVQERLVTLELQRAILPLHDEPFDVPGLRIAMRYLPAPRDPRGGGDRNTTARAPVCQLLIA